MRLAAARSLLHIRPLHITILRSLGPTTAITTRRSISASSCAKMPNSIPNDIYQYSLHTAYTAGLRTGGPPVAFLTNHGTYGYGFFSDDSEMLQIDTVAYRFDGSGKATKAAQHEQMPFTMVCVFQPEARDLPEGGGVTLKNLREWWTSKGIEKGGRNLPMPFAVRGAFSSVTTSHETLRDVQGTIFGFAVPEWQKDVSGGWSGSDGARQGLRCAFLSGDKARGGTVLDFTSVSGTFVEWAKTGRFHLGMPFGQEAKEFEGMDF